MRPMHAAFYNDVYNIVSQIPEGRVLTYGVIADLMGWGKHQRMVGKALKEAPAELNLPCHRVVSSNGRTVPDWTEQIELLRAEGITFRNTNCVDIKRHLWRPQSI